MKLFAIVFVMLLVAMGGELAVSLAAQEQVPGPTIDYPKSLGECSARSDALSQNVLELRKIIAAKDAEIKTLKEAKLKEGK